MTDAVIIVAAIASATALIITGNGEWVLGLVLLGLALLGG